MSEYIVSMLQFRQHSEPDPASLVAVAGQNSTGVYTFCKYPPTYTNVTQVYNLVSSLE